MQVEVKVICPVEHAFNKDGNNYNINAVTIEAYFPGSTSPRVKFICPNGDQLIFEASELTKAVDHASIRT